MIVRSSNTFASQLRRVDTDRVAREQAHDIHVMTGVQELRLNVYAIRKRVLWSATETALMRCISTVRRENIRSRLESVIAGHMLHPGKSEGMRGSTGINLQEASESSPHRYLRFSVE